MDDNFEMAWWPEMTANRAEARKGYGVSSYPQATKPKRDASKEKAARKAQRAARKKQRH